MNHLLADAVTSAQALLWGPLAASALALAMAIAAVMLALPAPRRFQGAYRAAEEFRLGEQRRLGRLDGKLVEYEAYVQKRDARLAWAPDEEPQAAPEVPEAALDLPEAVPGAPDERTPEPSAEAAWEAESVRTAEAEPTPALALDPLEGKRAHLGAFLTALLADLDTWARLAGFELDAAVDLRAQVAWLLKAIEAPAEESTLNAVASEHLPPVIRETVKVMLSKTDRDADPERSNAALQAHIAQCIRPEVTWKLSLIDPAEGDRMDPQEHNSLGAVAGGSAPWRGCVARTRVRGLRWGGLVVVKAEVLEYD